VVLDDYERALFERAGIGRQELRDGSPLRVIERIVPTEWVDYNGHANDSRYLELSSNGVDAFMRFVGVDAAYLASGRSYFTVESHLTYVEQCRAGDRVHVDLALLDHDPKRMHVFTWIRLDTGTGDEVLLGTAEHLLLHVDTAAGKASPADPAVLVALERVAGAHGSIERPAATGRHVGQPR
jgi:carnitine 3-dehydrogenase